MEIHNGAFSVGLWGLGQQIQIGLTLPISNGVRGQVWGERKNKNSKRTESRQGHKTYPNVTSACHPSSCFPQGLKVPSRTFILTMPMNWVDECQQSTEACCDDNFLNHDTSPHLLYVVESSGTGTDIFPKSVMFPERSSSSTNNQYSSTCYLHT